jgi:chromate transporter
MPPAGPRHETPPPAVAQRRGSPLEVLLVFTRLGLTSFGGPVAHLGYFHEEIVRRRGWVDERRYADLVALCQFLPGPASSQVGMGIGLTRAGVPGAIAAFVGFTWPSALLMIGLALGVGAIGDLGASDLARGLKIAAVAVVAHAVWGMATKLTPDRPRVTVAILAAALVLAWPSNAAQLVVIALGGLIGWRWWRGGLATEGTTAGGDLAAMRAAPRGRRPVPPRTGVVLLAIFFALLVALPLLRAATGGQAAGGAAAPHPGNAADAVSVGDAVAVGDAFYRAGALVFGGGHVVLPLLQTEVVGPGWVDASTFTLGYGAVQAVPGPLFTFAGYLGAAAGASGGVGGDAAEGAAVRTAIGLGLLALLAVFLPSFLLLLGVWPFWDRLRSMPAVQAALRGVNAAVVGLLLAALYRPVWTSAIFDAVDVALALLAFLGLALWRWPAWAVVAGAAAAAAAVGAMG